MRSGQSSNDDEGNLQAAPGLSGRLLRMKEPHRKGGEYRQNKRPRRDDDGALTVYIEGDGFAWATRSRPSFNPTPKRPMGLELALGHPGGNVAYLARPCQFVGETEFRGCTPLAWTHARFSEAAVASRTCTVF